MSQYSRDGSNEIITSGGEPVVVGSSFNELVLAADQYIPGQDAQATVSVATYSSGVAAAGSAWGQSGGSLAAPGPAGGLASSLDLPATYYVAINEVLTGEFTIACWVKAASVNGTNGLAGPASGAVPKILLFNNDLLLSSDANINFTFITPLQDNNWHQLTIARSGSNVTSAWLDGVQSASSHVITGDFTLSAIGRRGSNDLNGSIAGWFLDRQDLGGSADQFWAGFEPRNRVAPSLSSDGVVNVGTWDKIGPSFLDSELSGTNGPISYNVEIYKNDAFVGLIEDYTNEDIRQYGDGVYTARVAGVNDGGWSAADRVYATGSAVLGSATRSLTTRLTTRLTS